jgi:hypothetical protein
MDSRNNKWADMEVTHHEHGILQATDEQGQETALL